MKMIRVTLILALALLLCTPALAEDYHINEDNMTNFTNLLTGMMQAYEQPSEGDEALFDMALEAIGSVSATDLELATDILDHWKSVYLNPDYPLYLYQGEESAETLAVTNIPDSPTHAFVVLGFELKDGELTDELIGRCEAAAAAARFYHNAILVCSGGATGDNNPEGHTEAGMMRDYLVDKCGIDAARVFTDERAMTTLENAVNTFAILRQQGVETLTVVTSSYHQRWGQVLYNAMAALCRLGSGYSAEIVGNYSFPIEPSERFRQDDRFALRQLAVMLGLEDSGSPGKKRP